MTRKTLMYLFIMLTGFAIGIYSNFPNIGTLMLMAVLIAAAVIMILYNISIGLKKRRQNKR
ncbi:hypothetical protein SAMN05421503_3429 [Terribacillus aidingensis]|uniref:Uncharacterized protein n=1 Tax=Terribacillus aidingensis TaxID=586416 RepID=A0A285P9W7_9BACI|nr:hypothetical protein [Terribacillus aidingensis]SNZ17993.1 hypothetical protein SAMN05421503_3429 [Terribacillus aidingensis]